MKRAKLPGLRRNAATAMGNRGGDGYLPALTAAAEDGDPIVRNAAAHALARRGAAATEVPAKVPVD